MPDDNTPAALLRSVLREKARTAMQRARLLETGCSFHGSTGGPA